MQRQAIAQQKPPELQVNPDKLDQFMGQVVGELGAAMNAALVLIGEKLGLYSAMAGAGAIAASEVAKKTNTNESLRTRVAGSASRRGIRHL